MTEQELERIYEFLVGSQHLTEKHADPYECKSNFAQLWEDCFDLHKEVRRLREIAEEMLK